MSTNVDTVSSERRSSALRAAARDDSGSVMLVAVACLVILFILSTMLLSIASDQTAFATRDQASQRRLHLADAGLNAYLYELKRDPNFWIENPVKGPVATSDGTWTVSASKSGDYLVVRSAAVASGVEGTRTIVSKVSFPTFADYTMLADDYLNIGADATIEGKLHSNSTGSTAIGGYAVRHAGKLYPTPGVVGSGQIYAVGRIQTQGSTWYVEGGTRGLHPNSAKVDFTQVTTDLADICDKAKTAGTWFDIPTPNTIIGYRLVLNAGNYSLYSLTGNKFTGGLKDTLVRTGVVPATGVFYFQGDVWVQGTYNVMVTVASAGDILVCQNLMAATGSVKKTCGLIAANNVWIPDSYPLTELPTDLTVQAALVAMKGECGAYLSGTNQRLRTRALFLGSRAYKLSSGMVVVDGYGRELYGFGLRTYKYDANLDTNPPPMFPIIHSGSLKVVTWTER